MGTNKDTTEATRIDPAGLLVDLVFSAAAAAFYDGIKTAIRASALPHGKAASLEKHRRRLQDLADELASQYQIMDRALDRARFSDGDLYLDMGDGARFSAAVRSAAEILGKAEGATARIRNLVTDVVRHPNDSALGSLLHELEAVRRGVGPRAETSFEDKWAKVGDAVGKIREILRVLDTSVALD